MSASQKQNNAYLMKSLMKQSSKMLENYKINNISSQQLRNKLSLDKNKSFHESSMNKKVNSVTDNEHQTEEFKRYKSENTSNLRIQRNDHSNKVNIQNQQPNQTNIKQNDYDSFTKHAKIQELVYQNNLQRHQNISSQQRRLQIKQGQSTQTQFDQTDKKVNGSLISNQVTNRVIPQKLTEQERKQKLEIINQAVEQERQRNRLLKIQEEQKVMKVISNKILQKKERDVNNQSAFNLHQRRQFIRSSSNHQSNNQQNSLNYSQQNSVTQVGAQIMRNTYNFKTTSKNCLQIMQEALFKRQQNLENNVPYYVDAAKDVNNLFTNDLDVSRFFQSKKLIQKQAMNETQFQNIYQQQQLDTSKQNNNYFGNLNTRTQSNDFSSQKLMLLKSISNKSQKQNSQSLIQRPKSHHLNRQYCENNKSQQDNNYNQINLIYTSPNVIGDDNCEIQDHNKIGTSNENNLSPETNCVERIKKLHKSVFDNNTNNHIRQFFIQKDNYTGGQSNNSTNITGIQRTISNNTIQTKSKAELYQTQNKSNTVELKYFDDNENYGPWDHQKTETNLNGSFNILSDRTEKNKK